MRFQNCIYETDAYACGSLIKMGEIINISVPNANHFAHRVMCNECFGAIKDWRKSAGIANAFGYAVFFATIPFLEQIVMSFDKVIKVPVDN